MKYNGLLNPEMNQPNQGDTFNAGLADSFHQQSQGNITNVTMMQSQPQQPQYSYPSYNPSMNYNQFYYENTQNIPVNKSMPSFPQPMQMQMPIQPLQYNVHNRYHSYNPSPHFFQSNPYQQQRVPMLNFNSPQYHSHSTGPTFTDLSTGRLPRHQQLPSISQSNPRMTRYASANRGVGGGGGNFGFNQPPENANWDYSRQKSLGRNMKNPSMF